MPLAQLSRDEQINTLRVFRSGVRFAELFEELLRSTPVELNLGQVGNSRIRLGFDGQCAAAIMQF